MMMHWIVPFCTIVLWGVTQADTGSGNTVLNPLQRALLELKDAYSKSPHDAKLCESDAQIAAECQVCSALGSPAGGEACCQGIDAFTRCHLRVVELFDEIDDLEVNVIKPLDESVGFPPEQSNVSKRYGSLFNGWNWFASHSNNKPNKRGIREDLEKRSGNVMEQQQMNMKRYGNLFGTILRANKPKRYGNLFGNLFSKYSRRAN